MNVVYVDWIVANRSDDCLEIGKQIDSGLGLPPVKSIFPVLGQSFDISKRGSIHPHITALEFIWEIGCCELGLQFLQSFFRHAEGKGCHFRMFGCGSTHCQSCCGGGGGCSPLLDILKLGYV